MEALRKANPEFMDQRNKVCVLNLRLPKVVQKTYTNT